MLTIQVVTMANDQSKIILENGTPFNKWRSSLQAKLARRNVIGHVFHDFPGIKPVKCPIDPSLANPDAENSLNEQYLVQLEQWTLGELEAKNIITSRLSTLTCPTNYDYMTAKELYDTIANTRKETAAAPYASALEKFVSVKFLSSADEYIARFLAAYQSTNNAASSMKSGSTDALHSYQVGNGLASALFVMGTKHVEWLNTWRDTRVFEANNELAPLPSLMSSLRAIAGNRTQQPTMALANSFPNERGLD